jgi:hypothetical protein
METDKEVRGNMNKGNSFISTVQSVIQIIYTVYIISRLITQILTGLFLANTTVLIWTFESKRGL